ncbi:hypothetical protein ACO0SA_003587 [Hanseniaspora valbyensis]
MLTNFNIFQFFILISLINFSSQSQTNVPKLDLSDPVNLNKFKLHFINNNISELSSKIQSDLTENYDLLYENYKINEFYDDCLIYKETNHNSNININNSTSFEDVIDYSLNKGLLIINNTTNTSEIQHLLPKQNKNDFIFSLDDHQGFIKSKNFPSDKHYKFLSYKAPFWIYRLTQDLNFIQYSENLPTYLLGESQSDSILTDPSAQIKFHSEGYYISVTYGNGSLCDATNLPREVELQFVCDSSFDSDTAFISNNYQKNKIEFTQGARIMWVKEPYVCKYQVLIGVPGLCEIDLFKNDHYSFDQSDDSGFFQVVCKENNSNNYYKDINDIGKFERVYNWNFDEILLGRQFIFMKSQSETQNDYIIYSNILSSLDELDFNVVTADLRKVFTNYIQPRLVTPPEDFFVFHSVEPNLANYEFDIEMFDLLGNYACTFEINLVSLAIKVSNKRLKTDSQIVNKNFLKIEISEDVLIKEEELNRNNPLIGIDQIEEQNILQMGDQKENLAINVNFNPADLGVDNDMAKSILEEMLKQLEQQQQQN